MIAVLDAPKSRTRSYKPLSPLSERPTVIWDLDEVLANLREVLCRVMGPIYGVQTDWRDWADYQNLYRYFTDDSPGFIRGMIEADVLGQRQPEPDAVETVWDAVDLGYRNVIVSACGWHPDAEMVTWAWLKKQGMDDAFDDVIPVSLTVSKAEVIGRLGPATLYVEDSAHHIDAVMEHCDVEHAALVDRSWNRSWSGEALPYGARVTRVHDLHSVSSLLRRLKHRG